MSGIVALFNLAKEPINRSDLERLTEFLAFRGPDAQRVWQEESQGFVGLGHTQLATTWEAAYEQQPFSLDQQVWIIADARIDDRATLAAKLGLPPLPSFPFAPGTPDRSIITDVELILRAYLKWGEACVEHFLGDFAFVIWDGHQQTLFSARDHYGTRHFYYSRIGNLLIISNTLNCLRQHPLVSNTLNESVLADFFLFDFNYDPTTTVFADIQRLPAAHTLTCKDSTLSTRCYWTLTPPELLHYRSGQDYVEHYHQVLGQAVSDRLRTEKIAAYFSGGLDSTSIATTALKLAKQNNLPLDYRGYCVVYDHQIPDQERYYAGLAADFLQMPLQFHVADHHSLYQNWQGPAIYYPQPYDSMLSVIQAETYQTICQHSRVLITGDGGDETCSGAPLSECLQQMPLADVAWDLWQCLAVYRLQPDWGFGVMSAWRKLVRAKPTPVVFTDYQLPNWLQPEFVQRQNMEERWQNWQNRFRGPYKSPKQRAYRSITQPRVSQGCDAYDSGSSQMPIEVRHPYLDLRMIRFMLSLPPIPWCVRKHLQRLAMQNALPIEVLQRPKSPQAASPLPPKLSRMPPPPADIFGESAEAFIDVKALFADPEAGGQPAWQTYAGLRALGIGYWLRQLD